ncbi:DMT family transporter [Arthrobacter sp. NPDC058130]|uniref:EamA family transporter n=1 Tax=Arthrobacter sp. NPDC058130 TaxID=3346353 RepID=UPI0036E3BDCF
MRFLPASSKAGGGPLMAAGAMCSAQLAAAVSVGLSDRISVEDLTWLRLVWASIILVVFIRPWRTSFNRAALLTCLFLGLSSGAMTMLYMISITRLPLGTATALEFLGPLGVAMIRARGKTIWWAAAAAAGVVALTEPWQGGADLYGIVLALAAGLCWALYIVFTQRAGDDVAGLHALALSVPVATVVATFTVGISIFTRFPAPMTFYGLGIALLLPVAPYILELLALRRLTAGSFGILMSLQPAVAVMIGFVFLAQIPHFPALLGIVLVIAAGIGATRNGGHTRPTSDPSQESAHTGTVRPPVSGSSAMGSNHGD